MTRSYLTPNQLRDMLERQHGLCASPGCMSEGPFEADHSTPQALKPGKPDQLLCVDCHRRKTFGLRGDVSNIAKARRIAEQRTQYDKRKLRGPKLKSAGKIKSRGFDKLLRKKMDRTVVRND